MDSEIKSAVDEIIADEAREAFKRKVGFKVRLTDRDDSALFATTTPTEAARMWGKSWHSVVRNIETGKLDGRKSGGTWLVTFESLYKLWGLPVDGEVDW